MKRFTAAFALILLAVALAVVEYRAAQDANKAEFERTFAPAEYASVVTSDVITARNTAAKKRIRVSAPLENTWVTINATVLQADGTAVDTCHLYIDYFVRPQRGVEWTWGLPMASSYVTVPAEGFRLRLEVAVEPSGSTPPPVLVQILPPVSGSHVRLFGSAASAMLGMGLLLRSLVGARGDPHRSSGRARELPRDAIREPVENEAFPSGRFHFLDGLRGIAAVAVLMCHLFVGAFMPSVGVIEASVGSRFPELMRNGALGVEIFFVLSGFVIAYAIQGHRVTPGFILRFVGRRFLRLNPPYFVALFLALLVMACSAPDSLHSVLRYFQTWTGLAINALYLQDLLGYRSPFGTVAWTLCLEVQFYLALVTLAGVSQWVAGLLANPATRARVGRWSWWVLFGALGIVSYTIWHRDHGNFHFLGTWFRFVLGVLTFRILAAKASPWPFALLLGFVIVFSVVNSDARGFTAAATAGLILAAGRAGALGRWLHGRIWQFLGRISYSLYLFHTVLATPLVAFVWSFLPHTITIAVMLVPFGIIVAIASGWGVYVLIERPSVVLSQRIRYPGAAA